MEDAWVRIASSVRTWRSTHWFSNDIPPKSARWKRCVPRRFSEKDLMKRNWLLNLLLMLISAFAILHIEVSAQQPGSQRVRVARKPAPRPLVNRFQVVAEEG